MNNICIIPARGGSKRIPKKNITDFLGKPLISYSIKTAIKSNLFQRIIVSTDSSEIKEIAESMGAEVPFMRTDKTANDFATTSEVISEVIEKLNLRNEPICCLYPTAVLCDITDLSESFKKLISEDFLSIVPIVRYSYPIERALKIDVNNKLVFLDPSNKNTRTQDCEDLYHDCGQWYWIKSANTFHSIFTENTGFYIIEENKAQDIDNPMDLELAKIKYEFLYNLKK